MPQQPCCRMTKVTISPDSMTKMTNARNTYDKEDKFDHNRLSQNQYTDPEVGLDTVAFEDFLGPSIAPQVMPPCCTLHAMTWAPTNN